MSEKWELFVDMFWKCKSNQETNFIITCSGIKIQKHRLNVLKNNPLQDREISVSSRPSEPVERLNRLRQRKWMYLTDSWELASMLSQRRQLNLEASRIKKAISLHFIDICVISKLYVVAR